MKPDTTWLTATVLAQDLSILACLVIFAITPKTGRKEFLLLGLALLFSFLTDVISLLSIFVFKWSVNVINNIGVLLFYTSYILFYKQQIKSKKIGIVLIGLLIFFIGFALINMFFIQGMKGVTSYSLSFRAVSLIIISLIYFYTLIKELPTETITKLPMFWINTGVLVYFSGTFFQYLLADYLINVLKGDIVNTWTIKNFIGILYYGVISIGLWHNRAAYVPNSSALA